MKWATDATDESATANGRIYRTEWGREGRYTVDEDSCNIRDRARSGCVCTLTLVPLDNFHK